MSNGFTTDLDMLTSNVTQNMFVIAECSQAGISSFTGTAGVAFLTGADVAVDEDATGVGTGVEGFGLITLATEETEAAESGGGEGIEPGEVAGVPSFRNRFSRIYMRRDQNSRL